MLGLPMSEIAGGELLVEVAGTCVLFLCSIVVACGLLFRIDVGTRSLLLKRGEVTVEMFLKRIERTVVAFFSINEVPRVCFV